jgi:DNA polymerase III delta subunit
VRSGERGVRRKVEGTPGPATPGPQPPAEWPQNLLIWASDARFLDETANKWCEVWGREEGASVLAGAEVDPAAFVQAVRTLPMWQERQVVRLRQAEAACPALLQTLSGYLDSPSPSTALLVEFAGELKKPPSALWRDILGKTESRDCGPKGAAAYVRTRSRAEGFSVAPEAVEALEEWAFGDVGRLASALDLLFLYRASEKTVRAEDLEQLLGAGGTPKLWDLQEAFLGGNRRSFSDLLCGIERDQGASALAFVATLGKQVRALLMYQGLRKAGRKATDISYRDLGFNHPYPAQKLLKSADLWPEGRLRKALGALFELDLALKGHPAGEWVLVEQMLGKLL